MRIGSLFSGAGGLDMAVEEVFGGEVIWQAEVDKAASKVLAYRFPCAPNLGDITQIDWKTVEPPDVLCGGFPCTDVSSSGKRAGMHGTRSGLWSHMAEAIDVLRPQYVVIENVRGLLNANANRPLESHSDDLGDRSDRLVLRAIGAVLGDLADIGSYEARWITMAASDIGAAHRRERVFIVAHSTGDIGSSIAQSDDAATLDKPRSGAVRGNHAGNLAERVSFVGRDSGQFPPVALIPTPVATDANSAGRHTTTTGVMNPGTSLTDWCRQLPKVELLSTPQARDHKGVPSDGFNTANLCRDVSKATEWGKYEPAIRRWEQINGSAPSPTEPNKNGNPRLSAAFSEWMMGWPAGWVTEPDIGISRNDQLKIVGNGVCPQQAVAALRFLLSVSEVAA